jgi:glycosyltransferase involved in cell wall biosynthesis
MIHSPLLTICIPTFNRSKYLKKTLDSIVKQKIFIESNQVQVVISDNASSDDTRLICDEFVKAYTTKVVYHCNQENILDLNFEKALSLGSGDFLKLNNDTLVHKDGSLEEILKNIQQNINEKPVLYYANGLIKNYKDLLCNDLNSFISRTSFNTTWIGAFGIWREDYLDFTDFNRAATSQLVQVDVLFRMIAKGKNILINNNILMQSIQPEKKGGYNIFKIFVENYLNILESNYKAGLVNYSTLYNEKSKLMIHLIVPWYLNLLSNKSNLGFVHEKSFSIIFNKYKYHPYLLIGILYYFLRIPYHFIKFYGK